MKREKFKQDKLKRLASVKNNDDKNDDDDDCNQEILQEPQSSSWRFIYIGVS